MEKPQKHAFTLVELMVAMAILVIMMGFLFQFVIGAQRVWSSSSGSTALYEQAQLVFDFMGKDLKNIRSKSTLGEDIPFYYATVSSDKTLGIISEVNGNPIPVVYHFVSSTKKLYRLEVNANNATAPYAYLANKTETNYLDNFNFSSSTPWTKDILLAENLHKITVEAMKKPSGHVNGYATGDDFPYVVRVTLKLFDRNQIPADQYESIKNSDTDMDKYLHTFTKIFFLK